MLSHLDVRVPWHDARWNGTVCRAPRGNSFCLDLDNIHETRDDALEERLAGLHIADLTTRPAAGLPTRVGCVHVVAASGGRSACTPTPPSRPPGRPTATCCRPASGCPPTRRWPPRSGGCSSRTRSTSTPAAPSRSRPTTRPPFRSAWVFGRARQEAIGELFFGRLTAGVVTRRLLHQERAPVRREHQPAGRRRRAAGQGRARCSATTSSGAGHTRCGSGRSSTRSARRDADGFLVPYHDYLEPTGDPDEDRRRGELVHEIAVVPEQANIAAYSYAGELASSDITLSTCVQGAGHRPTGPGPRRRTGAVGHSGRTGSTRRSPRCGAIAVRSPASGRRWKPSASASAPR